MSPRLIDLIINATWQTLDMVFFSCAIAVILGLPLGVILFATKKNHLLEQPLLQKILAVVINAMRSIPFIILMVAMIPLTRLIVGTSIGTLAAIVPLSLSATPFFARLTETALNEVSEGIVEASQAMGASPLQIIIKVLVPEALPTLVRNVTLTAVMLVGYSAMAGVVGGGGLGDLAIRYGYQRFEIKVMIVTIVILIALVQSMQYVGDRVAARLSHYK